MSERILGALRKNALYKSTYNTNTVVVLHLMLIVIAASAAEPAVTDASSDARRD